MNGNMKQLFICRSDVLIARYIYTLIHATIIDFVLCVLGLATYDVNDTELVYIMPTKQLNINVTIEKKTQNLLTKRYII